MALITRLSRWFRADLHAVLDRLEEPELLLQESIREMEDALEQAQQAQAGKQQTLEQLQQRAGKLNEAVANIEPQLELCFSAENEALLRPLLRRRLEQQRLAEVCATQADQLGGELKILNQTIARMQQQLDEQRRKAETFGIHPVGPSAAMQSYAVSDEEVELALLAARRARSVS